MDQLYLFWVGDSTRLRDRHRDVTVKERKETPVSVCETLEASGKSVGSE